MTYLPGRQSEPAEHASAGVDEQRQANGEERHRLRGFAMASLVIVVLVTIVALATGRGGDAEDGASVAVSDRQDAPEGEEAGADAVPSDRDEAEEVADTSRGGDPTFFAPRTAVDFETLIAFARSADMSTAMEVERYGSLEMMVTWSSAVIVGRIVGTEEPYEFQSDDVEFDRFSVPQLRVAVDEVLSGDLDPRWGTESISMYWMGDEPMSDLSQMPLILFLRDYADPHGPDVEAREPHDVEVGRYRLVSSQGLYVSTPEGAPVAPASAGEDLRTLADAGPGEMPPTAYAGRDPVLREVRERGFTTGDLLAEIRRIGDRRVEPW